jgi:hypothetical protein
MGGTVKTKKTDALVFPVVAVYKNYKIMFSAAWGEFFIEDDGKHETRRETYKQMTNYIDKLAKADFKPVKALLYESTYGRIGTGITEVETTSEVIEGYVWIKKKTKQGKWERSKEYAPSVYLDTKENRKLLKQLLALSEKEKALKVQRETVYHKLQPIRKRNDES